MSVTQLLAQIYIQSILLLKSTEQVQNFPAKCLFTSWNNSSGLCCMFFWLRKSHIVNSHDVGKKMINQTT